MRVGRFALVDTSGQKSANKHHVNGLLIQVSELWRQWVVSMLCISRPIVYCAARCDLTDRTPGISSVSGVVHHTLFRMMFYSDHYQLDVSINHS